MDTTKIKSFWERPEGNTGLVFVGALVVGGGIVILKNIEVLIALAANTLYFGALLGCIFLVGSLLMNKRFRFLCGSMFQSAMRAITGIWISVDPIGILKNYLVEMQEKMRRISKYVDQLASHVSIVRRDIDSRNEKVKEYMRIAAAAKKRNDMGTASLQATFAGRESEFITRRQKSLGKLEQTLETIKQIEKNLDYLYQDTDNQVTLLTDEYNSAKAEDKVMKGADEIIGGDEAKVIFDQTCQFVTEYVGAKLGEMDRFMERAQGSINSINLKNDVFNEQGLEMLANWEKGGILNYESGQLGKNAKVRIGLSSSEVDALEAQEMEQQARANGERPSSFSKIFNK